MANNITDQELENLILSEKKNVVRALINDAWDDALFEEIENNIIAEMCINIVMEKLADEGNSADISRLLEQFKNISELGFLPINSTIQ